MLPFLKKRDNGYSPTLSIKIRPQDKPEETKKHESMRVAAKYLIDAMHSNDIDAVASALRYAFKIADSEPHVEGEHLSTNQEENNGSSEHANR